MANKIEAGEIRIGNILLINNILYKVSETSHVKPGKGGAFAQIVAKQIGGKEQKLNLRYRTEETVDQEFIYEADALFIDKNENFCTFLNLESQEMIDMNNDLIDHKEFLEDNMKIKLSYISSGEYIGISLPQKLTVMIADTSVYIKGQTEKATDKLATITNGAKLKIPQYVNSGDKIIVGFNGDNELYFMSRAIE